jgi:uncharacterized protein with NRDE domain
MCIAYIAFKAHADWPLILMANRDEFHTRPSLPAAPWVDHPEVIAGRDAVAHGTWLGVTRQGRFALLTNYRDPPGFRPVAPSRGHLVSDYLQSSAQPQDYISQLTASAHLYNGFNLIVGDSLNCWYLGSPGSGKALLSRQLGPGIYTLSNHLLDTPWPKTERLRHTLNALDPASFSQNLEAAYAALQDRTVATDDMLPQTGLTLDRERMLSSIQIVGKGYGTRCSTIFTVDAHARALLSETTYDPDGKVLQRHDWPFSIRME